MFWPGHTHTYRQTEGRDTTTFSHRFSKILDFVPFVSQSKTSLHERFERKIKIITNSTVALVDFTSEN